MSFDVLSDVNYLAVLVAGVAYFVIGGLWYSVLFGRAWRAASGVSPEGGMAGGPLVVSFIVGLVISLVLAMIARSTGASTVGHGIVLGLVIGVGVAFMLILLGQMFERRAPALTWINGSYHIVAMIVAGIIVTIWD